jgi:hypothetical protein
MAIGDKGTRENPDGTVVIQMAKRSEQLNGIYDRVNEMFKAAKFTGPVEGYQFNAVEARQILGMMETVGIVADELESMGK